MTLSYFAPRARYADAGRLVALVDACARRSGAPGVRAVGIAQALPFAPGVVWLQAMTRDDPRGVANLGALPHVHYNVVSAGYAEALGVPTEAGRTFDATDTAGSLPVVVINEALARASSPAGIRRRVAVAGPRPGAAALPRRTIVGVVGDARWSGLDEPAGPEAGAVRAAGRDRRHPAHDVRRVPCRGRCRGGDAAVRAQAARADADLPLTSVRCSAAVDQAVWRQRLAAAALGALGMAALAVALMGVLAVTSYLVGAAGDEMGVRLALGARPRRSSVWCWSRAAGWCCSGRPGCARRARDGAPALDDALRRRRRPTRRRSPRPAPRSPRPRSLPAMCRRGGRRGRSLVTLRSGPHRLMSGDSGVVRDAATSGRGNRQQSLATAYSRRRSAGRLRRGVGVEGAAPTARSETARREQPPDRRESPGAS